MTSHELSTHTPSAYRSTARFVAQVLKMLDRGGGLTLASLDFDHMGYFLKMYGSLRVERALEQCWHLLELRLAGLDAAILRSSLDETEVAVSGLDAPTLAGLLREHARDVYDAGGLLFGSRQPSFGFTAVVSETPGAAAASPNAVTPTLLLASSNQRALEAVKASGGRGDVRAAPFEASPAGTSDAASALWSGLASDATGGVREAGQSFREFESRALAHTNETLLLVTPRFNGADFGESPVEGGRTLLPDGTSAGKLGYLNRIFGEHLTPNLVVERALDELVRACPWPCALTCAGSTLILRPDADLSPDDAFRSLLDWVTAARETANRELEGAIRVSHVQVALLPASSVRHAIDLAHRVYQLPCRLHHASGVFVHDCRDVGEDVLAGMSRRYELEAAAEIRGG